MKSSDLLSIDELAYIFSFLHWKDILRARVNQKWKEATALTLVPPTTIIERGRMDKPEINVNKLHVYKALPWLVKALPNLQQLSLVEPSDDEMPLFEIQEGQNPTARWSLSPPDFPRPPKYVIDLSIISNLKNLRILNLSNLDGLNGKYPFFFQFPRLQKLRIYGGNSHQWDLDMLSGLPMLQDLYVAHNHRLTGNIKSLKVLKKTLRKVTIATCWDVKGDLMELADFEYLEEVCLVNTKVTGDIRHIKDEHFQKLTKLDIPDSVYGGGGINRIDEAPEFMATLHSIMKKWPTLIQRHAWHLNHESEDFYETNCHHTREPPFTLEFKKAGKRQGWRWSNHVGEACEMHWLDPEPNENSEDYAKYLSDLEDINRRDVGFYRGFLKPPSEEEHRQLLREIPLDPMLARIANQRNMMSFGGYGFW